MKRYYINEAKSVVTDSDSIVTTVKYTDNAGTKWITNVEVNNIPNFYITDEDIFNKFIWKSIKDENFQECLNEYYVCEIEGIELNDYEKTFRSILKYPESSIAPLIKYVIALTRCNYFEVEDLIALAVRHYIDEVDVPMSDVEEDYIISAGLF